MKWEEEIIGEVDGVLTRFAEGQMPCVEVENWLRSKIHSLLNEIAGEVEGMRCGLTDNEAKLTGISSTRIEAHNNAISGAARIIRDSSKQMK